MNFNLRDLLHKITENALVDDQAEQIVALSNVHPHEIEPLDSQHPIGKYTCVVHAFCLVGDKTYEDVASFGIGRVYAGKEFMEFLLERRLLRELKACEAKANDLVIYFMNGEFRHVGRINAQGKVVSKWGVGGLYAHALFEVPISYGNEVKWYIGLDADQCFNLFIQYAKYNGFQFE